MIVLFAVLFALWLVFTVAIQIDAFLPNVLASWDILGLLPRWTFFAPNPGHTDIRLLVRFGTSSGLTPWSELQLSSRIDGRNSITRGFFNPYRRIEKLLFDFRNVLIETKTPSQIRMCSEYIGLLMVAETVAERFGAKTVQFMLAETNYSLLEPFKVVLVSDTHLLHNQA